MTFFERLREWLFRRWPGDPPDWQWRRLQVFDRAFGRCEECGWAAGRLVLRENGPHVARAHVHHVLHRARGGSHALANLRLLCASCHAAEHPGNVVLTESAAASPARPTAKISRGHLRP